MLFNVKSVSSLIVVASLANAKAVNKRADVTGATLYVYGSDVNGPAVFYADGKRKAYFGNSPVSEVTGTQTNITFGAPDDTTTPWAITANSTTVTFNETLNMYINPTGFDQVGFASAASVPSGDITSGFAWFGKSVAYAANSSDYKLMFSGVPTNTTGVYALYWNGDRTLAPTGSFPVTVKRTAPTFPSLS
ncbi:hypothetical protein BJ875DRAFT_443604 [Amylocarpus encephaloides]|uniref:Uncharacterized protein n=1 Tax=Amylocarpus encephaloides TaxID=45428 RepID=A0A9P8C4F3_9HELO|nr:hypothetical protein BJ875DRAFT_443604 [Amylocarpus encephaloides]